MRKNNNRVRILLGAATMLLSASVVNAFGYIHYVEGDGFTANAPFLQTMNAVVSASNINIDNDLNVIAETVDVNSNATILLQDSQEQILMSIIPDGSLYFGGALKAPQIYLGGELVELKAENEVFVFNNILHVGGGLISAQDGVIRSNILHVDGLVEVFGRVCLGGTSCLSNNSNLAAPRRWVEEQGYLEPSDYNNLALVMHEHTEFAPADHDHDDGSNALARLRNNDMTYTATLVEDFKVTGKFYWTPPVGDERVDIANSSTKPERFNTGSTNCPNGSYASGVEFRYINKSNNTINVSGDNADSVGFLLKCKKFFQ